MSGLKVADVSVIYDEVKAVDKVSFEVPSGQIVALLGPSGSGKSSLLRAVLGLEPITSGQITWDGENLAGIPTYKRGFGLMFQDGQLFPHQNVAGNVGYGLKHTGLSAEAAHQRVTDLLQLVGLADFGSRQITEMSGGQAQRVALARSLAPHPKLLALDEPLSALDRSLREWLSVELRRILTQSKTAGLYVTHDQDEAFTVADRIGVLIDGKMMAFGTPAQVWTQPGTKKVAEFLGYGPFISAQTANKCRLNVEGDLIGLAPGALRVKFRSAGDIALPVTSVRAQRGEAEVGVRLPDDQIAKATSVLVPEVEDLRPGDEVQLEWAVNLAVQVVE